MAMPLESSQLDQFIDVMGGMWFRRELEGKVYASFNATGLEHAGVYASTSDAADTTTAADTTAAAERIGSEVAQRAAGVTRAATADNGGRSRSRFRSHS
jgi:hypothetical protein